MAILNSYATFFSEYKLSKIQTVNPLFLIYTGASKKLKITDAEVENFIQLRLKYNFDRAGGRKRRPETKRGK